MREILSRGKRIDNGKWVEGYYLCLHHDEDLHIIVDEHGEYHRCDPDTIGQYTCLTDKNRKRIFEWDVLRANKDGFIGVVKYIPTIASFIVEISDTTSEYYHYSPLNEGDLSRGLILEYTEIIGNIHDNPELLEGG